MLEAGIFLDGGRIRQVYGESFRHQPIDKPIP